MGSKSHTKRQSVIFALFSIVLALKLPLAYSLQIIPNAKKLCDSLGDTCSLCQTYAFGDTQSDIFTGIPKFNELVASISYEYLYDIVENFIKEQDELVESNLTSIKNDVATLFAPVESFFGKAPDSIETMNNRVQKFVECIKNKSQKGIRDSLESIKKSTLTTIVSDFDDLSKNIKMAEKVSFTTLGDVFGKAKCYSIFTDVQKCCSLKYLTNKSSETIEATISSNPSLNLKECADFKTIEDKFLELDEALMKQEKQICA
ncbi:hypothetical protein MACJ_001500 [Theileria orientalis]|uniref:Uncharacterized protein n=1 Tax=Theileria orientalis TaxID=68886 RepID=A0A976M8D8_THEOR|nr:hypothetical protein MACJ_001500 [Theileria orientalis]